MSGLAHRPVLLDEVIEGLRVRPEGRYVDGTFGRGGHARAILERLSPEGRLFAVDKDPAAVTVAQSLFGQDARFAIEQGSFASLHGLLAARGWLGCVDGLLLDLGVSSPQLDDAARGFSFRLDGPLDMRMDPTSGMSAAEWLQGAGAEEIAAVLREYGEERHAGRIARAVVRSREEEGPITTTARLAQVIARASPGREPGKDPATRSFQAIRIFVNRELEDLEAVLSDVIELLAPGGRLAIISFHSLEDRRVKQFIRREERGDEPPHDLPIQWSHTARLRAVGKAIRPGAAESADNPRARSAVLRIAERVA